MGEWAWERREERCKLMHPKAVAVQVEAVPKEIHPEAILSSSSHQ